MRAEQPTWPPGSRSRTVDVDGPVHLTEYGDDVAELMVCLHGLGGSALNFGLVAPQLSEHRRVLVPDLLGHGRSFAPGPDEAAVDSQLRMLSRLLKQEADHPVVLVGHSMGGVLAMLHTLREPDTVDRLVLTRPAGTERDPLASRPAAHTQAGLSPTAGSRGAGDPPDRRHDPRATGRPPAGRRHTPRRPNSARSDCSHSGRDPRHPARRRRSSRPACTVPRHPRHRGAPRPYRQVARSARRNHGPDPVAPGRGRSTRQGTGRTRPCRDPAGLDVRVPGGCWPPSTPRGPDLDDQHHHRVAGQTSDHLTPRMT